MSADTRYESVIDFIKTTEEINQKIYYLYSS